MKSNLCSRPISPSSREAAPNRPILLAARKGYFLAACTESNLIFVRNEFKSVVEIDHREFQRQRHPHPDIFWLRWHLALDPRDYLVPWHRLKVHPSQLQIIPRYLRLFGEDYSVVQKLLFALFVLLRFPGSFMSLFREKVLLKQPRFTVC